MSECGADVAMLVVRVADGSASAQEHARVMAHTADCASCRIALADQRAVHEWLQAQPIVGATLGFDARVMAAVRAEVDARGRSWLDSLDFRRWTWRLVPVAAALGLVALAVTRTDAASAEDLVPTQAVTTSTSDALPVSSALWSDSVSESSLLSLMLSANADDTLGTYRKDQ
jgi:anti-sigma factor RsiW